MGLALFHPNQLKILDEAEEILKKFRREFQRPEKVYLKITYNTKPD